MAVTMTERAAKHVLNFLDRRGRGIGLRLGVQTSGCSGMAYKLEYVDEPTEHDEVFDSFGVKIVIDAKSGEVLARYDMVIGIEDLAFDNTGALWSVSEAGSLRWQKWGKTFPVVFRVDLAKLK